ncbi:hypothetical protein IT087_04215 [Candidatus Uhrbacteria bacterium]|nr:hypothetical protein [Candidatus Uhrbacteria bacterium]
MPPQAAAVPLQDPSQELLPKQEAATEAAKPAKVESMVVPRLESMLEKGDVNGVKEMIKGMTKAAAEGMQALQEFPEETQAALMEAAPEEMKALSEAQAASQAKLEQAEQALLRDLGTQEAANDVMPVEAANEAPAEVPVAAPVEAVQVMPIMKVGEAPNASPELVRDAEEQRDVAAEMLKEEYAALSGFTKEHGLTIDNSNPNNINVSNQDLNKLTNVERSYVQVLTGKHMAANASLRHAEKLLEAYSVPEGDPRRVALEAEAKSLEEEAILKEKAAQIMQDQYVKLPEIIALTGGGGDSTGGSYGGHSFEPAASPFGGEPKPPQEPPKFTAAPLYGGGGVPGEGIAKIEAYKTPDSKVTRKPSFIDRWFRRNVSDLTYGAVDATKKDSRE